MSESFGSKTYLFTISSPEELERRNYILAAAWKMLSSTQTQRVCNRGHAVVLQAIQTNIFPTPVESLWIQPFDFWT
jgi:hypothetical protein